jgi:prolyl-tRNA synthetase
MKGVPVRIAIGPRDLENKSVELARRDTLEKQTVNMDGIENKIADLLNDIQKNIYLKSLEFRKENTYNTDSWEEFKEIIDKKGGFVKAHWDGTMETENAISEATKATIRCIPLDNTPEEGKCIYSGKPSKQKVIFAKAY